MAESIAATAREALDELGIFPDEADPLDTSARTERMTVEQLSRHTQSQWLAILSLAQHVGGTS